MLNDIIPISLISLVYFCIGVLPIMMLAPLDCWANDYWTKKKVLVFILCLIGWPVYSLYRLFICAYDVWSKLPDE